MSGAPEEVRVGSSMTESYPQDLVRNEFSFLRPLEEGDAGRTLAWRTSPRSSLLHRGSATVAEQTEWIRSRPNNELNFVACCSCGRDVGMISLVSISVEDGVAEPARFFVDRKYSGSGFAVAAIDNLYRLAFEYLGLSALVGAVVAKNPWMIEWQRKFGMVVVGESKNQEELNGVGSTLIFLELSRKRYESVTLPEIERYFSALRARTSANLCPCSSP